MDRYYVRYFEKEGETGDWSVLERDGARVGGDRVVCDCPTYGNDELDAQAESDAKAICGLLNSSPASLALKHLGGSE